VPDGAAVLDDLETRGLLQDTTDRAALARRLAEGPVTLYHGIDPSASSLHIGNFVGVVTLRRFQDAGHRPIVLVGGATGMIGDPGGRSEERNLLDEDTLAANVAGIRSQLERLVDLDRAELVNNLDWTRGVGVLDFLRDVGKHATVNQMIAKDSVRSRMEGEHGISFTEFSYQLLQANDYWWLHSHHGCELQIGGSDQWGNIVAGIDLIRRRSAATVHGLTWPLITRADGQKFGKSVDGAVWLDANRTLPYEFHQYWLRTDDRDVERFLLQLTLLDVATVAELVESHATAPERRVAQQRLADEVTALVHGAEAVRQANLAATAMFGTGDLDADQLGALRGVLPETRIGAEALAGDEAVVSLLVETGLAGSRSEARRLLAQQGVSVNRHRVSDGDDLSGLPVGERYLLLQRGKKQRHLVVVEPAGGAGS
jgi:tyrosyl-tRNA synthetase